ncbi:MAG: class I SAM-dependent methyltransferase [Clostridia bacterium]|nr:class I SAM-dependent methyltransferase [Clostridia bacterium]
MQNENVKKQYATDRNLSIRIRFQQTYSVNQQGFGSWILQHYALAPEMCILELGCGNGSMWAGKTGLLPQGCRLILSDFSKGMLEAARNNIGEQPSVSYELIDIAQIPYGDASMDAVIANMMLYHVPDLDGALAEVRRVLRPGSAFYCATYGVHGIMSWLNEALKGMIPPIAMNTEFTLQNGEEKLWKHFHSVTKLEYPDAFLVTRAEDLAEYVMSLTAMADVESVSREMLMDLFESRMENGVIRIPKEYGMFICR